MSQPIVRSVHTRLKASHPDGTTSTGARVAFWSDGRVQVIGTKGTLASYDPGTATPQHHSSTAFDLDTPDGLWSFVEDCGCGG